MRRSPVGLRLAFAVEYEQEQRLTVSQRRGVLASGISRPQNGKDGGHKRRQSGARPQLQDEPIQRQRSAGAQHDGRLEQVDEAQG